MRQGVQYPNKTLLKMTAGVWRENGPQITAHAAWNAPVAIVVSRVDPRPTSGAAALTAEEAEGNARAIAEVPRLIQALAMLLVETRAPGTYAEGAAAYAAARALRHVTLCDQTPDATRAIADDMQAQFNADATP